MAQVHAQGAIADRDLVSQLSRKSFASRTVAEQKLIVQYVLSTKRCMLGNQDRYLARVVLFLLCSPILSPLQVISRKVFDEQLLRIRPVLGLPLKRYCS